MCSQSLKKPTRPAGWGIDVVWVRGLWRSWWFMFQLFSRPIPFRHSRKAKNNKATNKLSIQYTPNINLAICNFSKSSSGNLLLKKKNRVHLLILEHGQVFHWLPGLLRWKQLDTNFGHKKNWQTSCCTLNYGGGSACFASKESRSASRKAWKKLPGSDPQGLDGKNPNEWWLNWLKEC